MILDAELKWRKLYAGAFGQLFWAFLFIGIQINIEHVDVVPHFVGYILIFLSAKKIRSLHPNANLIRNIVLFPFFVSLIGFVEVLISISGGKIYSGGVVYLVLAIISSGITIIIVWDLCKIIAELAQHTKHPETVKASLLRRKLYAGIVAFSAIYICICKSFFSSGFTTENFQGIVIFLLFWILFISLLVITFLLMGLMKQAERICLS